MTFWLIFHLSPEQIFFTLEISLRIYNWPLRWSSHAEHAISASMVNLVHSRYTVSQQEAVGKSSQGIPALHTVHAPLKPVDFDRSIGTPCHRGSSKGRVGRWKEYFKLVLNASKLKTQAPSRQIAEMPASAAFPGAHSLLKFTTFSYPHLFMPQ